MTEQQPTHETTPPASDQPGTEAAAGAGSAGAGPAGRDWLAQLQSMIENIAEQAAPVAKEVAAKAAELAAVAAEKAGPFAQKAAEVTADAGVKFAEKSRNLATELRRDLEGHAGSDGATSGAQAPVAEATPAAVVPAAGDAAEGRSTIEG